MDWCRLGEVSALYDELLVSVDRLVTAETEVAWVEMDDVVSLRSGGEADCRGESRRWAGLVGGVKDDSSPLVAGGASIRLGAGCMLSAGGAIHGPSSSLLVGRDSGAAPLRFSLVESGERKCDVYM